MSSFRPFIVGIGGTTRPGSSSEKALRYALALAAGARRGCGAVRWREHQFAHVCAGLASPIGRSSRTDRVAAARQWCDSLHALLPRVCFRTGEERARLHRGYVHRRGALSGRPSGGPHRLRARLAIHRRGVVGLPVHRARAARMADADGRSDQYPGGALRRKRRWVSGEQSVRQMSIMVGQVVEFARLRLLLADLNSANVAASGS